MSGRECLPTFCYAVGAFATMSCAQQSRARLVQALRRSRWKGRSCFVFALFSCFDVCALSSVHPVVGAWCECTAVATAQEFELCNSTYTVPVQRMLAWQQTAVRT